MAERKSSKKKAVEKSVEASLWESANKLRGSVEPAEYNTFATLKEIEAKNWSLVPSKYIEFKNRDEAVNFDEKMRELHAEMRTLLKAEKESEKELAKVFKNLGFEL